MSRFIVNTQVHSSTVQGARLESNPPASQARALRASVVDCFQIRSISHRRFAEKIGSVSNDEISLVKKSIALILDIEPEHCELDD